MLKHYARNPETHHDGASMTKTGKRQTRRESDGRNGSWGQDWGGGRGRGGGVIICQRARTPKCAKSRRSAARTAHCFLVCQVFRAPRPSGGRAIVAREVVQPLSLDKAGDLMLFYRALCWAESRNGEACAHTRERDVPTLIVRSENVDDDVDVTSTTGASIICHFAFVKHEERASPKHPFRKNRIYWQNTATMRQLIMIMTII